MSEGMAHLILALINWIKANYKKPKLWITVVLLILLVYWLVPYIDSNFFYYERMEKRISILQELSELDQEKISSNIILQNEYEDILNDIQGQDDRTVNSIVSNFTNGINEIFDVDPQESNAIIKFFMGALWFILITVLIPFMKTFKNKRDKYMGFFIFLFLSIVVGMIFANVPTILNPYVNYIGMPAIQLLIVIMLALKYSKKENT